MKRAANAFVLSHSLHSKSRANDGINGSGTNGSGGIAESGIGRGGTGSINVSFINSSIDGMLHWVMRAEDEEAIA